MQQHPHRRPRRSLPWSARAAAAASITVGMIAASAQPGYAEAPGAKGPDGGAPPAPDGSLSFPATPQPFTAPPSDVFGPLALEIINAQSDTERLGEQLKVIDDELAAAKDVTAQYRATWEATDATLQDLKAKAAAVAGQAYKDAAALGPFDEYANDLQNLSLIAPALPGSLAQPGRPPGRDSIGYEVAAAAQAEQAAKAEFDAALAAEKEVSDRRAVVNEQFERHRTALKTLQTRNASLLGGFESARNAYEDSLALSRGLGTSVNGLQAAPRALSAVSFALRQQGKPYEWAAEGPNSYDCSGLMLASYQTVGIRLPRVSRFQYGAGTPVLASQLLPGDLIFFSTDRSDWRQIHHVAMYIGGGKMVHAPTFGDVVRVSPIWWTEYFGAIRVVPAVAGPTTPPPTTPPPTTPPPTTPPPTTAPPTTTPPTTTPPTTTTTTTAATTTTTTHPVVTTTTTTQPAQTTTTTTNPTTASTTTAPAGGTTTTAPGTLPAGVLTTTAGPAKQRRRWRRR